MGRLQAAPYDTAVRSLVQSLAVIAALDAAGARAQEEWSRIHIGAAYGSFQYAPDFSSAGVPEAWPTTETKAGWKVVGEFRPARAVGVEFQLITFNEEDVEANMPGGPARGNDVFIKSDAEAVVVSALLFLPESLRADVYGKVGVAVLKELFVAQGYDPTCGPSYCGFDIDESDLRLSLGIGARFSVAREGAMRLEYEVIDGDVGEPTTMLSVGIAWEH